jgi:hypothetical protein
MDASCVGHVKNTKPHLGKLEDKSTPMVLLGYNEGNKAYRLYDPKRRKVVISRDVVFDEMATWDWVQQGAREASVVNSTFTIKHLVIQRGGGGGGAKELTAGATREQAICGCWRAHCCCYWRAVSTSSSTFTSTTVPYDSKKGNTTTRICFSTH